jgi:hypothetical protein
MLNSASSHNVEIVFLCFAFLPHRAHRKHKGPHKFPSSDNLCGPCAFYVSFVVNFYYTQPTNTIPVDQDHASTVARKARELAGTGMAPFPKI